MARRITLEVCVDGPDGLMAAISAGADRIELCGALPLDGLTPSPGLMRLAAAQKVPSWPMIHPRPGGYVYSPADVDLMLREIDAVRAAGLPGIVIGAQTASGGLDGAVLRRLADHAAGQGLGLSLHRVIDIVADPAEALEMAMALGFVRVLTSGGRPTAADGADAIAGLVRHAAGRISIMPGCGVSPANAVEILRRTGATEIHGSFGRPATPRLSADALQDRAVRFGFLQPTWRETDAAAVAAVRRALDAEAGV